MIFFDFTCKYCHEKLPARLRATRRTSNAERNACRDCWITGADIQAAKTERYLDGLYEFERYRDGLIDGF